MNPNKTDTQPSHKLLPRQLYVTAWLIHHRSLH